MPERAPTAEERAKERAFTPTFIADIMVTAMIVTVAVTTGSLTMLGEAVRTVVVNTIDGYSFWVLRGLHRGRLDRYQYGVGKLERLVWVIAGFGMLFGALWVTQSIVRTVFAGDETVGPLGLTIAAVVNAINTTINGLGLYAMYRAAGGDRSGVFGAQLRARQTMFMVSVTLQVTLTVAALAKDPGIALVLDAIGAVIVVSIKLIRGTRMIADSLPDILDAPAQEDVATLIRETVWEIIPDRYLVSLRTRRSGELTFARAAVRSEAFAEGSGLQASLREIEARLRAANRGIEFAVTVEPEPAR